MLKELFRYSSAELKKLLSQKGLDTDGRKSILVTRLVADELTRRLREEGVRPIVLSYADRHDWGGRFMVAMKECSGVDCKYFESAEEVEDSENVHVYMHPDHTRNRVKDRLVFEALQNHTHARFIPTLKELLVYDEKVMQSRIFADWLPNTLTLENKQDAIKALDSMDFPFVSKSNEGAASSNVRFIETRVQAIDEIELVFSESGMPRHDSLKLGLTQKGYVHWQRFLGGNENDWRVIMMGKRFAWILKRYNRPNVPFASGSGDIEPITSLNDNLRSILDHVKVFAEEQDLQFLGTDLVQDPDDSSLQILETTTGWAEYAYADCVVYEATDAGWRRSGFKGKDQWYVTALCFMQSIALQRGYSLI